MDWVLQAFRDQGGLCACCREPVELPRVGVKAGLNQASVDRVIDQYAHTMANCRISYRSCNFGHK